MTPTNEAVHPSGRSQRDGSRRTKPDRSGATQSDGSSRSPQSDGSSRSPQPDGSSTPAGASDGSLRRAGDLSGERVLVAQPDGSRQLKIVMLNWRDTTHPEGGGSERYVETVAAGLARAGHDVTLMCARYPGAAPTETRDGYTIVRRGGKLAVYGHALRMLVSTRLSRRFRGLSILGSLTRRARPLGGPSGGLGRGARSGKDVRLSRPDVVVDVQNGMPFWSRLVAGCPIVVLVHHVHREQWPVVYGRAVAALGWWLESVLAPWIYRRCRYVTVSEVTRRELAQLGVRLDDIDVIHNGTAPAPLTTAVRASSPRICVLGRLVPHKRVEHALAVVARLRHTWPGLRLSVIGAGYWSDRLTAEAVRLGVDDITEFHGYLDEQAKHDELARCWLMVAPSLKEGWGMVVAEAAAHRMPSVGYQSAGGLAESIVGGTTGLLVEDLDGLTAAVDALLSDDVWRDELGRAAAEHAARFDWERTVLSWERLLGEVCS